MTWLLSFFLGSPLGRLLAGAGLTIIAAGLIVFAAFRRGVQSERVKQKARQLENVRKRIQTDDEIARLPAADRRKRLSEWMRD